MSMRILLYRKTVLSEKRTYTCQLWTSVIVCSTRYGAEDSNPSLWVRAVMRAYLSTINHLSAWHLPGHISIEDRYACIIASLHWQVLESQMATDKSNHTVESLQIMKHSFILLLFIAHLITQVPTSVLLAKKLYFQKKIERKMVAEKSSLWVRYLCFTDNNRTH